MTRRWDVFVGRSSGNARNAQQTDLDHGSRDPGLGGDAMIERFDDLTEPPVIGRYYLVRCIFATFNIGKKEWLPVMGPRHDDAKWIGFKWAHYHLNRFFLSDADEEQSVTLPVSERPDRSFNYPITESILLRRKCRRSTPTPFPVDKVLKTEQFTAMYRHYTGEQCRRQSGWICPHKGFDLGAMTVDPDGAITCPMHGLRIDNETGIVRSVP